MIPPTHGGSGDQEQERPAIVILLGQVNFATRKPKSGMDGTHSYNIRSSDSEKGKQFPEEANPPKNVHRTGVPTLEASSTADSMQLL